MSLVPRKWMRHVVLLHLLLFVIGTFGLPVDSSVPVTLIENHDQSACDWAIWDSTSEAKGVRKVSVSCSEGQITWRNPYGGLRIEFSPPSSTAPSSTSDNNNKYEVCFEATSFYVSLQLSTEGDNHLTSLAVLNAEHSKLDHPLCFQSTRGNVVTIYIEADSSATSLAVGKLTLDYDIRVSDDLSSALDPDNKGCRPCTESELVLAACISDYAFVGSLRSVTDDVDPKTTVIDVGVTHVLHQRLNVVVPAPQPHSLLGDPAGDKATSPLITERSGILPKSTYYEVADFSRSYSNTNNQNHVQFSQEFRQFGRPDKHGYLIEHWKEQFVASVYTPSRCRAKSGDGLFLFMGRVRLKKALLQCAPRLSDFVQIWDAAVEQGSNPCSLD